MSILYPIICTIKNCGESDEISKCSFLVPSPISKLNISEYFPFEGQYHFRLRVPGNLIGFFECEYVYLDINDNDEIDKLFLPKDSSPIHLQALLISEEFYEENKDHTYMEYLENCKNIMKMNLDNRIIPSSIVEGANILWKLAADTVKATTIQLQQHLMSTTPLSDLAVTNLAALNESLETRFNEENPDHVNMLQNLWTIQIPDHSFQRISPLWKDAGWQSPNPIADVKSSGMLAIQSMIFFGNKFSEINKDRILKNKANIKTNYPFAIVGVNLTLLLAELFSLRDNRYLSTTGGCWTMFEDPTAFFEIFCVCFHHVDSIWNYRKAVRADFGKIIGETKILVDRALRKNPKNIQEFKFAAADEGMMIHDLFE